MEGQQMMEMEMPTQDIESLTKAFDKVKGKLTELNLEGVEVALIKHRVLEAEPIEEGEPEEEYGLVVSGCTKLANEKKLKQFKKWLDTSLDVDVVSEEVLAAPQAGEKFNDMMVYNCKTNKKSKLISGKDRKGKIQLIHFWSIQDEESCESVDKLSALAKEKAEEWKNKVSLTQLLVDQVESDDLEEAIDSKGWYNLHHCRLDFESKSCDIEIESMPLCVLVNAEGIVVKRGSPEKFDFARDIDALVAGEPVKQNAKDEDEKKAQWGDMSAEQQEAVFATLTAALKDGELDDIALNISQENLFRVDGGDKQVCEVIVQGYVPEPKEAEFKKVADILEEKVSKWDHEVIMFKPCAVPKAMTECGQCGKKAEEKAPFFVCAVCADESYTICAECEQNKADNKHKSHAFIKVHGDADNTDKLLFGPGKLVCEEGAELKENEECYCDRCGETITAVRYKCCHCPNFDFCETCFQKWEKGEDEPQEGHAHVHGPGCCHDHAEKDEEEEDEDDEEEEDEDEEDDDEFNPEDEDDDEDEEDNGPHSMKHVFVKLDKPGQFRFKSGYEGVEGIQSDEDNIGRVYKHKADVQNRGA